MTQIIETTDHFYKIMLESNKKLLIIDFYATWCGPCKKIAPLLKEWQTKMEPKIKIVKINVENDALAKIITEYGIRAMPTFVFFKNMKPVATIKGANPTNLLNEIQKQLNE